MPVTLPVPFVNRAARSVQGPVEYVHTFKAVDSPVSQYNSVTDARDAPPQPKAQQQGDMQAWIHWGHTDRALFRALGIPGMSVLQVCLHFHST